MVKGVILVDWTDQGRRTIKDSPDRAEASKAEATKLGIQVKELFYTPGGAHDAAIVIEAEGPEPINKFMASVQFRQRENEVCPGFLNRGNAQDGLAVNWLGGKLTVCHPQMGSLATHE
jgi:uncharacterized protein with GYD domain